MKNERIRQLADEAGFMDSWFSESGDDCEQELKKFAELIIGECIEKIQWRKKFAIEDEHNVDHAFDLLVYDIESHFGVEE